MPGGTYGRRPLTRVWMNTESYKGPEYSVSISKEELAKLPTADYDGNIKLIDSPEQVDRAVSALRSCDIIGFDTETRPSFKKGQSNTVSLLQLSTRSTCYLFRLNLIGLPDPVKNLLEDGTKLKIGLSIHDDFHNLNKIREIEPHGFVELQQYAKRFRIADNSLTKMFALVFGKRISKGQRLTNWEAEHLTEHQQAYASLDAMACIDLYESLKAGKFDPMLSKFKIYSDHLSASRSIGFFNDGEKVTPRPIENRETAHKDTENTDAEKTNTENADTAGTDACMDTVNTGNTETANTNTENTDTEKHEV